MNDANSDPMADVFATDSDLTPCAAVLPGSLCEPPVNPDLISECQQASIPHSPADFSSRKQWWASEIRNFNFKRPDDLDSATFNRVLWRGVTAERPYPIQKKATAKAF